MKTIRYWLDFFTVPPAILAALYSAWPDGWMLWNAVLAGYVAWVFFEYFMHRVILHRWYRAEHWVHHRQPKSYTAHVPQLTIHGLLLGAALASLGLLGARYGAAFYAGLTIGYYTYIATHNLIHQEWITAQSWGPIGRMVARHDLHHHRGFERNFNVLNPLGDVVFGTLTQPERAAGRR